MTNPKPDSYLREFIPPWAVQCWTDDAFVYTAIPTKSGPPLIQRYALTEGGLTKAINILKVQRRTIAKGRVHKESAPPITKLASPRRLNTTQRDKVLAALRKSGILS